MVVQDAIHANFLPCDWSSADRWTGNTSQSELCADSALLVCVRFGVRFVLVQIPPEASALTGVWLEACGSHDGWLLHYSACLQVKAWRSSAAGRLLWSHSHFCSCSNVYLTWICQKVLCFIFRAKRLVGGWLFIILGLVGPFDFWDFFTSK